MKKPLGCVIPFIIGIIISIPIFNFVNHAMTAPPTSKPLPTPHPVVDYSGRFTDIEKLFIEISPDDTFEDVMAVARGMGFDVYGSGSDMGKRIWFGDKSIEIEFTSSQDGSFPMYQVHYHCDRWHGWYTDSNTGKKKYDFYNIYRKFKVEGIYYDRLWEGDEHIEVHRGMIQLSSDNQFSSARDCLNWIYNGAGGIVTYHYD